MKYKVLGKIAVMTAVISLFTGAFPVYADDLLSGNGEKDEFIETDGAIETDEIDQADEISETKTVTAIDTPDVTEYSFDYKTSLALLTEEFPKTITIHYGDVSRKIDAKWICEKDYNDWLLEYPFIPDMEGYTLAEDVELPVLTVTFEKEIQRDAPEPLDDYEGYEIPILSDGSGARFDSANGQSLPKVYNLFEDKKLPPVRNQGQYSTCWAFSAIGAIESDLIHDGTMKNPDLSELHLAYYGANQYNDPKNCYHFSVTPIEENGQTKHWIDNRGEAMAASKLFSNLVGIVSESDVPYSKGKSFSPDDSMIVSKDCVRMKNAYLINTSDTDSIKRAIMEHGGVSAKYYDEGSSREFFNSVNSAYYCTRTEGNHLVMFVGWDDDFPVDSFNDGCRPEGPGAWLVRNSWGQDGYGYNGYFWLSYYDKSFNNQFSRVVAFDAVTDTYDNCYAYDGAIPGVYPISVKADDTVKMTYKVSANELVRAMAFETGSVNVTADVTLKNKKTGDSVSKSITTTLAGIYTVEFDKALKVPTDAEVEMSIRFRSKDGSAVDVICEYPTTRLGARTFTGKKDKGLTVISGGKATTYDYDPRLKLYTDNGIKVSKVTLNKKKLSLVKGYSAKLKATVTPGNATFKDITWNSSNKKVATVDKKGNVKGVKKGTATITAKSSDGSKSATCKVTVTNPVKVKKVKLNTSKVSIKKGKTVTLKATVSPKDATNKEVTWKSNNKKIATVDKKGKVKGIKKGKTKIKVTTKDGKKTASCTVTVK